MTYELPSSIQTALALAVPRYANSGAGVTLEKKKEKWVLKIKDRHIAQHIVDMAALENGSALTLVSPLEWGVVKPAVYEVEEPAIRGLLPAFQATPEGRGEEASSGEPMARPDHYRWWKVDEPHRSLVADLEGGGEVTIHHDVELGTWITVETPEGVFDSENSAPDVDRYFPFEEWPESVDMFDESAPVGQRVDRAVAEALARWTAEDAALMAGKVRNDV